jgi:hypothetical protein
MPEKLNWRYSVQVAGGPTVSGAGALEIEAYEKLSVTVQASGTLDVEIVPGTGASLQVLVISPATPGPDLSYDVSGTPAVLDGPHVLIGAGAVGLLAATVGKLTFKNDGSADAALSILAGRDATP